MIASIGMAIESLDTKSSAQIPKGDGFVTRCCEDIVGERLKGDKIHRVHMPAEGLAASHAGHVEGFDRLILMQSWCACSKMLQMKTGQERLATLGLPPLSRTLQNLQGHGKNKPTLALDTFCHDCKKSQRNGSLECQP